MSSSPDLGTLPHDIDRIIIRLVGNYTDWMDMRLISPSWNIAVLEHLKATRIAKLLPLERVYLHSGFISSDDYATKGARHNSEANRSVHMHAIVPDHDSDRLGVGRWLSMHQVFPRITEMLDSKQALEVFCAPQKFEFESVTVVFVAYLLVAFMLALLIGTVFGSTGLLFFAPIAALAAVPLLYWYFRTSKGRNGRAKRRGALLKRFFSAVSTIDTLVLDHLADPFLKGFDAVVATLGDVRIDNLEVKEFNLGEEIQERIVKLTRKHGISQISILCYKCSTESLAEILQKLVKLGASVHIFEQDLSVFHSGYFGQPLNFWIPFENQMRKKGASCKLNSIHDLAAFDTHAMNAQVRARIRCVGMDVENGQAQPPIYSRGFFRSQTEEYSH